MSRERVMSVRRRRIPPRPLPLSAATVLTACTALLAVSLVPADAQLAEEPERPTPAPDQLLAIPGGNTFPVPAPYEVSFSDSWHACRDGCGRQHKGNDLMTDEGTPIVAVESGVVAKVDSTDDGNGGLSVWLLGDSGVAYYYAHNSANLVAVGQQVARGQQIARVGHTGNARTTPPHIHFQINRCGELSSAEPCTVDPYQPLHSWPQEQIDGGADALGLYTPADAKLRLRTDGGSPLPLDSYRSSPRGARDVPLAGDWNGDGRDTVGLYRPADATFRLRDDTGAALPPFRYGAVDDLPLAGDWDGDGRDTVGLYRPSEAMFYLRDDARGTLSAFRFGTPTRAGAGVPQPVAGDWDGDRRDTVALFRPSDATFLVRDHSGAARPPLRYGTAGDLPLTGDWDGDGRDTVGVYRPADASYHLQGFTDLPRDGAAEPADAAGRTEDDVDVIPLAVPVPSGPVVFGPPRAPGARPVAGDWNGRDLVTLDDLDAIWGSTPVDAHLAENLPLLNAAMVQSGVVTPARKAAFLATVRNESRFRFDAVERGAADYRGRGFIQLTGEHNYRRAGTSLGLDLVGDPGLVTNPLVSSAVTSWYWTVARNINLAADRLDMAAVNIAVGYRPTALEDFERCADFIRALEWFNGGTLPDGVNCERSLAAIANAIATAVPEPAAAPDPDPAVPPASVTEIPPGFPLPLPLPPPPAPSPTTGPPSPTPTTRPRGSTTTTTTTTTAPPPTTTVRDTTTTTGPPPTTTVPATTTTGPPPTTAVPETTTSTEPPSTTTEAPSPTG